MDSPRFPDSPPGVSPDIPLCAAVQWSDQDCSCFSDSECFIVDVTQPVSLPPKKRTLMDFLNSKCSVVDLTQLILSPLKKKHIDYFQPAAAALKQGLPYSLQRYYPQHTVAELSNPKRSTVNRTYSLSQRLEVLQYIHTYILKLRQHVISVLHIHERMERSSSLMIGPVKYRI